MKGFGVTLCHHPQQLKNFLSFLPSISSKRYVSYLGEWKMPEGHDTGITIYNSAASKTVPLILKRKNLAKWYMCGPTVYAESHIGHASCYIKCDIIRRILENMLHVNVILLLGITDIDDKIIKKSIATGVSASYLAKKYELEFFEDMKALRVLPPTAVCRVSENIPLIISFCKKLIETEFAYATEEGNVYFMVSKSVTADVLSEMTVKTESQTDGSKKDPRDFALWKTAKPNEPFWESPWGRGRPGWHIECSAMASQMFGSELDLHSGGYDLLFPHHANEKSQSESFHSCSQWVNYWLHTGLLQVDNELKMSKSLGNTISIQDFLRDHCVNDFRILCLQSLYRKNLFYTSETLSGAKGVHKKLHNFINECEAYISGEMRGCVIDGDKLLLKLASTEKQVMSCFKNDFNASQALFCLTDLVDEVNKSLPSYPNASSSVVPEGIATVASCYFYVNGILKMLGVYIVSKKSLPKHFTYFVDGIVEFRNKIRLLALSPKDTAFGEGLVSTYVNDAYTALKLTIISESEELSRITDILKVSTHFYEKVYSFAETLDREKAIILLDQMKAKDVRKKLVPLFTMCDDFRSSLLEHGIGIKDRGSDSSWIPLTELEKILQHYD